MSLEVCLPAGARVFEVGGDLLRDQVQLEHETITWDVTDAAGSVRTGWDTERREIVMPV